MEAEVLCSTPHGVLHRGDRIWFQSWMGYVVTATATGMSGNGRYVYARTHDDRPKVVEIENITRIA